MKGQKEKTATAHLAHLQVAPATPRPKLAKELNLACPPALLIVLYLIITIFSFVDTLTAQTAKTTKPKFETFNPFGLGYCLFNKTVFHI